jgi:hypothetical protein
MIRKIALGTILAAVLTAACGAPPPETIDRDVKPLYVDQNGVHGPFATDDSDAIWTRGEIEVWGPFGGQRYVGDMGDRFYVVYPPPGVVWISMSPNYTVATAREFAYDNGTFGGRYYQVTAGWHNLQADGWYPRAIQVRYSPPCPTGGVYTVLHVCTGAYTPYDDGGLCPNGDCSPLPTVVIGDGAVQAGLPYGNPLKLTPAADGAQRVECIGELADYGLGTGKRAVVYGCP